MCEPILERTMGEPSDQAGRGYKDRVVSVREYSHFFSYCNVTGVGNDYYHSIAQSGNKPGGFHIIRKPRKQSEPDTAESSSARAGTIKNTVVPACKDEEMTQKDMGSVSESDINKIDIKYLVSGKEVPYVGMDVDEDELLQSGEEENTERSTREGQMGETLKVKKGKQLSVWQRMKLPRQKTNQEAKQTPGNKIETVVKQVDGKAQGVQRKKPILEMQPKPRKESTELGQDPLAVIGMVEGEPDKWIDAEGAQQFRWGLDRELDREYEVNKIAYVEGAKVKGLQSSKNGYPYRKVTFTVVSKIRLFVSMEISLTQKGISRRV
ncbi:unnamed protein product [Allacma fusca]|uniref:Uncharacterized protein n=1 Tax=Allacma fusca TaxID=39272 RepID=A0A8J2PA60_9HEXA|nr:unnamed protein product [Allacma fusca]